MSRPAHGSNTKQQGHPLDHPEISAGWLSRLFYRWTGPLLRKGLTQPQVSLDDLYPLLPEDRRDGRADAFLALTARQPVRPWPLTAFIWRHYKGRIGLLTLLQLLGMLATLTSPWLLNHSMTQLGTGASTGHKLLLAFALFASVLAAGMLAEHSLQLALKMHVPIRRLLAESLLAKVMKQGGKSFDDRAGGRVQNLINRDVWDITWILADPAMPVTMALQLIGTIALLVWQVGSAGLVGFAVLTLLTPCDWLTRRDLTPLAVELVTPAPADDTRHRAAFGVPPRFGQPVNRFLMAEADLLQPIPTHNPSLWALHEQLVEAELGQLGPLGQSLVSAKVRTEISRMLHLGEPRREDVAARLHLTDRTLQRRLQAESVSFQQLLDDTRSELARQYLADPRRSLAEVADQLGFSDQSNLFRACKRWFGKPPGQYRQQLGQPAPSAAFLAAAASR